MAEFVKGNQLNAELERIFEEAEKQLIIISPYIKLHSRIIDVLKSKKQNDKLRIVIVFGKNEDNISNSFRQEDFELLKDFPNIEIRYESRLHAKYYANESSALLSSMNLYDYSQNNNIEFGILTKVTLFGELTGNFFSDSLDKEAFHYFEQVALNSQCYYKRTPEYDESLMGLKRTYIKSRTEDQLSELLNHRGLTSNFYNSNNANAKNTGYCIRTGVEIPFNPEKPFSDKAYKSWSRYKDETYQEKYCHFSGEESNGETSFSRPILRKNWNQAKSMVK